MKRTNEKSPQSVTSPKPTTLNLQTRPFAPPQPDSSQTNEINKDESSSFTSSENLLEKLISTPKSNPSSPPVQRKLFGSLRSRSIEIQAKLNIGKPNDKYEKEADNTAAMVVQQINSPAQEQSVQRQESMEAEEEELQMKPVISQIQRVELEEELQAKSLLQRRENIGGGEASEGLESSIQSAKGSGQSLDANLQAKMGQVMGADFSGVKVHTDSQSDQLNKSIQAKAFTTGQDVFFRQGAYEPSSRGGQELIAHELTHVVQQNGSSIQRKSVQSSPSSALSKPITHTQAISIQAAFEKAYVNDVAQLHNVDPSGKDLGTVPTGKKLKAGNEIDVDPSDVRGEWTKATGGYIRKTKFTLKSTLVGPTPTEGESNASEIGQEATDQFGGGFDAISGGLEQDLLKSNQGGKLDDIEGSKKTTAFDAKSGLDIVSGSGDTLTGLFGMVGSAKAIGSDKTAWENLAAGYGFIQSLGKSTSGATKIVDSIAKASGAKDGVGKSDVAGKITGAIADGLSAVKDSALGIIGIYRLFKSQSDQKGKDALVTLKSFASAAGSAAKVAKSAFDIIGNGIPMAIINTVPALGIAVSAINLLIRLYDAFVAGGFKEDMTKSSTGLVTQVSSALGESVPTEENVESSKVFDKDRRGTFPNYKTYFRTKQGVRNGIKQVVALAQNRSKDLGSIGRKSRQERSVTKRAYSAVMVELNSTALDGGIKNKIKTLMGDPKTVDEFNDQTVNPLNNLDQQIDEYEYADKMSEINQKRQTSSWTDVILELVSMAGDITTIAVGATGIGAAIGQGVKAASAGYKVIHGGSKFVQKLYRDRDTDPGQEDNKSTKKKHEEYSNHAKFIYQQVANLQIGDTVKEKQLEKYIRATGVNYGMWLAVRSNPQTQVEMLVEAMKQRS